jgi:hypothetical protein
MKKILFCLFGLTLFISTNVLAETSMEYVTSQRRPSLGIQAGMNFENASTPAQISSNTYTGFTVGVNMELPIGTVFSIQPELNYARRGLNLASIGGGQANVFLHTIEIPVLAKLSFGESFRPVLFAGPQVIFNVSKEVTGTFGGTTTSASFNPRTTDFAAIVGLGFEAGAIFLNARYAWGIVDISDNSAGYYSRGFKALAGVRL